MQKKSHPWLNAKCEEAIRKKNAAESTEQFDEYRKDCSSVLAKEYQTYLGKLKEKIAKLKKGSKASNKSGQAHKKAKLPEKCGQASTTKATSTFALLHLSAFFF